MATNKDRIKRLEAEMQELRDGMQHMAANSQGAESKIQGIESILHEILGMLSKSHDGSHRNPEKSVHQNTAEEQKLTLAVFHLEGEANQWWQWLKKVYHEERLPVTWEIFEKEVRTQFGPTKYEDFNEALSRILQHSALREYQREFERLAIWVSGRPPKALIGTFLGGLNDEIAVEVHMFKPHTLREAIELARMRDDKLSWSEETHVQRCRKWHPNFTKGKTSTPVAQPNASLPPVKKIS